MATQTMLEVRKTNRMVDLTKEFEWLEQHRHEYIGQWVVLDGDRLVGHGPDPIPFVNQARAERVRSPFMEFIRDESEPFMIGILSTEGAVRR